MPFAFRRLVPADLPLLHRWLQEPHVRAFYDDGLRTLADVEAYYASEWDGPNLLYLASDDAGPFAYLQAYRIADHPAYAAAVQVGATDAAIDMLIGEPDRAGRGLGGPLLRQFAEEVVAPATGAHVIWIGPSPDNTRAICAYTKAGFVPVKTVRIPTTGEDEYFMRLALDGPRSG